MDKKIEITRHDRGTLAKVLTWAASKCPSHRTQVESILEGIPLTKRALKIGLTGAPGVGKSHLIEALAKHALGQDKWVAVLAVDPSSPISKGSILGDKTRMQSLAAHPKAYVRPQPSTNVLGGLTRHTYDMIRLLEGAGFDLILIESVGVGQSETMIRHLVDRVLMVLQPMTGDALQMIKKGVHEIADAFLINKSEEPLTAEATILAKQLEGYHLPVFNVSALKGMGISEVYTWMISEPPSLSPTSVLEVFKQELHQELDILLQHSPAFLAAQQAVCDGAHPSKVARKLLEKIGTP